MTAILSSTGTDGQTFANGDDYELTLAIDASVIATATSALILSGTEAQYDLTISGIAQGAPTNVSAGLWVQSGVTANITILKSSMVRADVGIYLDGNADFINHGAIISISGDGIQSYNAGDTTMVNTGLISGANFGIAFNASATGTHTILNSGVITATFVAIYGELDSVEAITNTGVISGEVNLAGGNDVVNNVTGTINSAINLENGDDIFFGGLTGMTINGGLGVDQIEGGRGNDIIDGGAGQQNYDQAQTLFGAEGSDQITGGDGYDSLDGGTGIDTLAGGLFDDDYFVDSGSDVIIENAGDSTGDFLYTIVSYTLGADVEIERMEAQDGFGDIDLTGNGSAEQVILGNEGNNVLDGGGNDGVLDNLSGAGGDDTYVLGSETSDTVTDTSGTDTITSTISRSLLSYTGIENLTLLGPGSIDGFGTHSDNVLNGNGKKNRLEGMDGDDVLFGGKGKDVLSGGQGRDTFDFDITTESGVKASTRDFITDFKQGPDEIDLSTIDAVVGGGDNAFDLLSLGTATSAVQKGQIGFYFQDQKGTANDLTILRINTDNDKSSEMTLAIEGLHHLNDFDFIL